MQDKAFSARNEALRSLSAEYRREKDSYKQTIILAHIAQIELMSDIVRRLDRLPIPIVPSQ